MRRQLATHVSKLGDISEAGKPLEKNEAGETDSECQDEGGGVAVLSKMVRDVVLRGNI